MWDAGWQWLLQERVDDGQSQRVDEAIKEVNGNEEKQGDRKKR